MPYSSFTRSINCDLEVLWCVLIDKTLHPDHYIPSLVESKVVVDGIGVYRRELRVDDHVVKEKVIIRENTFEIQHFLLEHPKYNGSLVYRVLEEKDAQGEIICYLTITLDWLERGHVYQDLDPKFDEMLKDAAEHLALLLDQSDD